jgi:GH15 family glucan-1,4-alpha-glucosidase
MYKKISDYGIIGDLHTVALIGLDGSIDWLCFPHLDSASIFGALLDDKKGGRFLVTPTCEYDSTQEYVKGTNILKTKFRTRDGILKVTDFMPIPASGEEELEEKEHELYRLVEVTKGEVEFDVAFEPRFDYARISTELVLHEDGVIAKGNGEAASLSSTYPFTLNGDSARARVRLTEGEHVWLHLRYEADVPEKIDPKEAKKHLDDTEVYWKSWLNKRETGREINLEHYKDMIDRSALVLKLLFYDKTGAIAAAATTSLPEEIGGVRNWDYRYTWVRDTSFTLQALFNLGHMSETEGYIRWVEKLVSDYGVENLQIMYSLDGDRELPEEELTHLDGYKGSRPVRIGNEAAGQKQLDIYGELMDAALKLSDYVGKIDSKIWPSLRDICDYVAEHWQDKDSGIWEVRGGPYHFVYSKVMCWVALDRGAVIARRYGFQADLRKWEKVRGEIKAEVLKKGWSKEKGAFLQHYDTDQLDSSNLLLPILGFLPFDDKRVVSNLEAIMRELGDEGFLFRYRTEDGLAGEEGTFLLCTFWLIDNLIALNRLDEAEVLINRIESISNHVGLFSEEYDFDFNEALGNYPQAFTHIGYINSVTSLLNAKGQLRKQAGAGVVDLDRSRLLADRIVLNNGEPEGAIPIKELAAKLKHSMNVLRGAFFDLDKGRIAYEKMHSSDAYKEHVRLSNYLKKMDLNDLKAREDKLAFWINLYNVIVIHGVIELVIKDSVKEVRNFFKRIQYQIGNMLFSPDDIEHGILRCNAVPSNALFRQFKGNDERLNFSLGELEPRIHFALVCGSSSCPPIEVYTAENIDEELTIAGEAFINGGGVKVYREGGIVYLSRIFKWYGQDFGSSQEERLNFILPYIYNKEDKEYIKENAARLKVVYQEYDWRLNKG